MAVYIISYDLIKTKDYNKIITAIKKYPWCKLLLSMWAIKSTDNISELHAYLRQHIDQDDELLVIKLTPPTTVAFSHLPKDVIDWLNANL